MVNSVIAKSCLCCCNWGQYLAHWKWSVVAINIYWEEADSIPWMCKLGNLSSEQFWQLLYAASSHFVLHCLIFLPSTNLICGNLRAEMLTGSFYSFSMEKSQVLLERRKKGLTEWLAGRQDLHSALDSAKGFLNSLEENCLVCLFPTY